MISRPSSYKSYLRLSALVCLLGFASHALSEPSDAQKEREANARSALSSAFPQGVGQASDQALTETMKTLIRQTSPNVDAIDAIVSLAVSSSPNRAVLIATSAQAGAPRSAQTIAYAAIVNAKPQAVQITVAMVRQDRARAPQIVNAAVSAAPEQVGKIVFYAIKEAPLLAPQIAYAATLAAPSMRNIIEDAAIQAAPFAADAIKHAVEVGYQHATTEGGLPDHIDFSVYFSDTPPEYPDDPSNDSNNGGHFPEYNPPPAGEGNGPSNDTPVASPN